MYLKDGREIYESDKFPGYFIDANTGAFCDEKGNYIGGNQDNGDKPGDIKATYLEEEIVFISKTGKQYYPEKRKTATIPCSLLAAKRMGYKPSKGYQRYLEKKVIKSVKFNKK